jgi:hypothetical protein
MSAMKAANKDLKGTMKTLKIDDIDVRSLSSSFTPNLVSLARECVESSCSSKGCLKVSLRPRYVLESLVC